MTMKDHFASLLEPLLPREAEIRHVDRRTDELIYRVQWKIPAQDRPNKRSRPIEIHIPPDTQEDYREATRDQDREEMDRRIVAHIQTRLAAFDPDHNLRPEVPLPVEEWVISPQIAGGLGPVAVS